MMEEQEKMEVFSSTNQKSNQLPDEEFTNVSGGEEKSVCPNGRSSPVAACKQGTCQFLENENYCLFFQRYLGGYKHLEDQ